MRTFQTLPVAVLRLNSRLMRIPVRLVGDVGMLQLDPEASTRLGYERFLIECDQAAACLLNDEAAAHCAIMLTARMARVRVAIAREHHLIQRRGVAIVDEQWGRFVRRRR
ncbi:hypothetical protein EP51_41860 (plasmid) [Rhodococcus opacus]|uniref:Uncharacterized protein n=2 Tax=Rhodococcus opacus TaxID=37919 RepID=A0A076F4S1_RHOOP|nr:hypothetical protein EP51_41860 [Rhodococcus opacus]